MTEHALPPANWYADPEGSGRWRYWDGATWTGVYLNQDEPGPGVWSQYWELTRWYVFGALLIAIPFAAAFAPGVLFPAIVFANIAMQGREETPRPGVAAVALVASATVGVVIWGGWLTGLGVTACGAAFLALARWRNRLPEPLLWFALAFVAFGMLAIIASAADLWRG